MDGCSIDNIDPLRTVFIILYIYDIVLIIFSEKNTIFLRESCQIVQPLAPDQIPVEAKENNYGLSNPGSIQAYLQVVDLMADKLRYASISLININLLFLLSSKIYLNCLCSSFTNSLRFIVQSPVLYAVTL